MAHVATPLTHFLPTFDEPPPPVVNVAAQAPPTADPLHDQLYVVVFPTTLEINPPTACPAGQRFGDSAVRGAH